MSPFSLAPRSFARAFSSSSIARVAKITVVGRLAATPELFTASSGQEMVRYAIGTNSGPPEKRETSWWRVASFSEGNGRDRLLGLPKGSLVYVEGEARMRKFEKEGKTESALSIVQQKLEVLKRGSEEGEAEAS
ncbi:MAG: ssDNA-binding protein, mitochondrial [Stictis urceolatum]|nr:ssDNA-binding protein, mitochondrial [Stictis urceolata]